MASSSSIESFPSRSQTTILLTRRRRPRTHVSAMHSPTASTTTTTSSSLSSDIDTFIHCSSRLNCDQQVLLIPHRRCNHHHHQLASAITLPLVLLFLLFIVPVSCSTLPSSTALSSIATTKLNVKQCPPGEFFNTSSSACSLCPPGTYSSTTSSSSVCTSCPLGTSQPLFGAQHYLLCRPCYPNTYASRPSSSSCTSCPPGKISGFGSSRCIRCPRGMSVSFTGPAKCERCKDGEYSDKPNAHFCDLCVADKLRIVKRLKPNGEVVKRNVGCDTCVAVTKNGRKRNLCGKCGFDSYREYNKIDMNNGNVVAGDGTCHECPMGTDSSGKKGWAGSKSMCLPCQPGFKRKQYERQCTPCPHGVIQAPGKGAMFCRTIMKPASATSKPIVSPTDCDSGYESAFINSDGVCVTCAPGSRRDPLLNSCVVCPPGSVSLGGTSTTCDVCPAKAGARPLADGSRCTCGDGRVYSASKGTCYSCGPGMFRNDADHLPDAGGCLPCEVGWVAPKYGSAKCSMCPYGMIAYTPGRSQDEDRLAVGDTMCRKCDRDEGQVEELLSFTNLYYFMGATKCINGRTLQGQFYGYNESGTPKNGNYLVSDWYYLTGFKPVNGEY